MSIRQDDIDNDEIRIISSEDRALAPKSNRIVPKIFWILLSVILAGVVIVLLLPGEKADDETFREASESSSATKPLTSETPPGAKACVVRTDTTAGGVALSILTPVNATPTLEIGNGVLNDTSVVLIAQAADIREDNGMIVGAYIVKGELVSKGESKAGFCSIINGDVTIGVADATPMFEQALMNDGYFFRQYPLVVGGQVVENKPKGASMRKALAEINGKISVIVSRDRATFHDFSQALIEIGATNAIYLVGGSAYVGYEDTDGKLFTFGSIWNNVNNVNYIVWR